MNARHDALTRFAGLTITLLAIATAVPAAFAQESESDNPAKFRREIDESYTVRPQAWIDVTHREGQLDLEGWDRDQVQVIATIEAAGPRALELGAQIRVQVDNNGGQLRVRTVYPTEERDETSFDVHLTVKMPRSHPVRVANSFGSTSVRSVGRGLDVESANGNVKVGDVRGQVNVKATFGDIEIGGVQGETRITGRTTNLKLAEVQGRQHWIENSFGDTNVLGLTGNAQVRVGNGKLAMNGATGDMHIEATYVESDLEKVRGSITFRGNNSVVGLSGVRGNVRIDNSHGDISLEGAVGDAHLAVHTGSVSLSEIGGAVNGNFDFAQVRMNGVRGETHVQGQNSTFVIEDAAEKLTVRNSFGAIEVSGVRRSTHLHNQSGDIRLRNVNLELKDKRAAQPGHRGPWGDQIDCRTTFGLVEIELPSVPSMRLNATATFGDIESDIVLPGRVERGTTTQCQGMIGDDPRDTRIDATIMLHSENGSIRIGKPAPEKAEEGEPKAKKPEMN